MKRLQIFACNNKNYQKDYDQSRVDTLDSSHVEVGDREFIFERLLNDYARDEVPGNNEENVNADESPRHE